MSSLSNRPQNKNCSTHFVKRNNELKQERIQKYNENPVLCQLCDTAIDYSQRQNKFCSSSCSAKYSNAHRKPCITGPKKTKFPYCRVKFRSCKTCHKFFCVRRSLRKYCSPKCRKYSSAKVYRNACKFNLNNKDHPELFDSNLIKKYGWYQPTNSAKPNLTGVTWDHLYRCSDGYKNNVLSSIMSHPANAELVPWKINYQRKESMITYEQLLERIKVWHN